MQRVPTKSLVILAAIFWGSALVLAWSIIADGRRYVGGLAGQSDWFWVYAEVVIKTIPLWFAGALAGIPAIVRVAKGNYRPGSPDL